MKRLALAALLMVVLPGCYKTTIYTYGCHNTVIVEEPKTVNTTPSITTGDNSIPLMP